MKPAFPYDLGESRFVTMPDGLVIHVRSWGPAASGRTPLLCLPGLSRNSRDFAGLAARFAGHPKSPRQVIAVDFRGRGLSGHDKNPGNYNIVTEAMDVNAVLTALGIEHAVFVGTSRGGLVTMIMAGMRPGAIAAAVLNDIGPVLEGAGLAQIRIYLQKSPRPKNWAEAIAIQKSVMAATFTSFTEEDWLFEALAKYAEKDGKIGPDHDPGLLQVVKAIDLSSPLPTMWPQFAGLAGVPAMVIRGANSALLSQKTVEQMAERHPKLTSLTIDGQGHAPLLHSAGIPEALAAFLDKHKL